MRLLNRVALITGANNPASIGAQVARVLAAEGAQIALTYQRYAAPETGELGALKPSSYQVQQANSADTVIASISDLGGTAHALEVDLAVPDNAARVFDWAESSLGPVEILINCAAHFEDTHDSILTLAAPTLEQTFAINVTATVLLMQQFIVRHRRRKTTYGRVVNFSTDGARCFPGQIAYAASKAAVESLTRSVAKEVISLGVTVNAIAPGPVQTGYLDEASAAGLGVSLCEARVGSPADVAAAVLHFTLPASSWTTGQILRVAGGHDL